MQYLPRILANAALFLIAACQTTGTSAPSDAQSVAITAENAQSLVGTWPGRFSVARVGLEGDYTLHIVSVEGTQVSLWSEYKWDGGSLRFPKSGSDTATIQPDGTMKWRKNFDLKKQGTSYFFNEKWSIKPGLAEHRVSRSDVTF